MRTKRTQPALPGVTLPTSPIVAPSRYNLGESQEPQPPTQKKRSRRGWRATLTLMGFGLFLAMVLLAMYPLLANGYIASNGPTNSAAQRAILGLFPWIPRLYWTTRLPILAQLVAHSATFNPGSSGGSANLLFTLLGLAFVVMLLAGQVGSRVMRGRLSQGDSRLLFWTVFLFATIFGLICLFAPGAGPAIMARDMFQYGLYGRLVTVYDVNPYSISLGVFSHDLFQQGIVGGLAGVPTLSISGPIWIDLCIPVALLAHGSIASVLMDFRLLGLIAHLANAILIWTILAKLKPEMRLSATILYSWNPLVLLMSISGMHQEVVVVLFLLLAILLFQRRSPMLAWVFLLLSALISLVGLLLLPLFVPLLVREARTLQGGWGRRFFWWLMMGTVTVAVIVLAYLPYWQNGGLGNILANLRQVFLQDTATNSLDAALIHLPITLPSAISWLVEPHHWTIIAAVTVGLLLVLSLWLVDTIPFVVMMSSWVMLALLVLLPTFWPWYLLVPLALSLCSANTRTILLAQLLIVGALVSYYYWLWQPVWLSQALVTVGIPLLIWGWTLFFRATWDMVHANRELELEAVLVAKPAPRRGFSRPSWPAPRR